MDLNCLFAQARSGNTKCIYKIANMLLDMIEGTSELDDIDLFLKLLPREGKAKDKNFLNMLCGNLGKLYAESEITWHIPLNGSKKCYRKCIGILKHGEEKNEREEYYSHLELLGCW